MVDECGLCKGAGEVWALELEGLAMMVDCPYCTDLTAATLQATARTLHVVAEWGDMVLGDGKVLPAAELHEIAAKVEAGQVEDWAFCPVCQEVRCDADCPLGPVRGVAQ